MRKRLYVGVVMSLCAAAALLAAGQAIPANPARAIPPEPALNAATHRVYVPSGDGRVAVRDSSTGARIADIAIAGTAVDVVVNPLTNLVYAVGSGGVVSVIDGVTNRVAATVDARSRGMAIGLNSITSQVYVGTVDGLIVVDGMTNGVVAYLPGVYANPDIVVNEATNRIYLSSIAEDRVSVIDGFSNALVATVRTGSRPAGLAVDARTNRIYAANSGTPVSAAAGDSVSVIDGFRNEIVATIPVGREDALGVAVDAATGHVAVTMSSGPAVILDTVTNLPAAAAVPATEAVVSMARAAAAIESAAVTSATLTLPDQTPASTAPGAAIYNLRLATDAAPDLTDLRSLVDSATSLWSTPREKVWALFYWSHILKRQTGPVVLHGFEVTDPIRNFADYGYTMCSTITGINQTLYEMIGLRHQYWDICNHTVSAVEYDGAFHMIDSSMSNLVTRDDGVTLASVEEAAADSARLVRERSLYTSSANGYLTGSDGIRNIADVVDPINGGIGNGFYKAFCAASLKLRDYYYNWNAGHRYVLNLREDDTYTRYFKPLGTTPDYWIGSEHIDSPDPAATFQNDSSNTFGLRGNGRWVFAPRLSEDAWARAVYRGSNIAPAPGGGLRPASAGTVGELVYKVQAANAIASQHIQTRFLRSDPGAGAAIAISLNHGATWTDVGSLGPAVGAVPLDIDLRDLVNAAYETLVRIRMTSPAASPDGIALDTLTITTITQVNTKALPRLNIGRNEIYLAAGDQTDTMVLWPDLRGTLWQKDAYDSSNVGSQPVSVPRPFTSVVYPATLNRDAYLTYRMNAPADITRVVYGGRLYNFSPGSYIDFLHSFDNGATWIRSYRLSDVSKPYDVVHYETVTGVPAGVRTVLFKYVMHNTATAAGKATGLYAARMEVNHRPAGETPAPVDVTLRWTEINADRTTVARSHTEQITAFPAVYVVNVGGADHPIMDAITTSVAQAGTTAPGYSDGIDAGGAKYLYTKRTEGTNLAQNKPYTISRAPSGFQNSAPASAPTLLTDGVVGAPMTGSFAYWQAQCWAAGPPVDLQIDLGVTQPVGSMRAHLLGYPSWDALKGQVQDTAEVLTSIDGGSFVSRGFLQTSIWKKDIPINYMLHDDERATAWNFELRLAAPVLARYVRYHLTPKRTLCATELQAFDHIVDTPFDIRIAPPSAVVAGAANVPPSVTLTTPASGGQFVTPAEMVLTADASDPDDGIAQIDFFAGATLIGSATELPFTVLWADVPTGSHSITARARDRAGAMTTSAPSTVIVANADDMVDVPDVKGLPQAEAIAALTAAHLAVGPLAAASSEAVPVGSVIAQLPGAGGRATIGTAVTLTVSSGVGSVVVPNVVGLPQSTATGTLTVSGLTAGTVTAIGSDTVIAGTVMGQSPGAGAAVPTGSDIALVVSAGPAPPVLPAPWTTQDIGSVGKNGAVSVNAAGTFSISGAGADIWGTADALRYVYQRFDGDGVIVARVATVQNSNAWVKAGVMLRTNLTAGSAQAMMMVTPSKSNNFQRRVTANGVSTGTTGAAVTAPYWVKLTRTGNTIAAAESVDGVTWSTVGTATIAMPVSIFAGLAVSSHVSGTLATATFDRVTVTSAANTVVVPDVLGLTQEEALPLLASVGLTAGTVSVAASATVPAGAVISQAPAAAAVVPPGSAVALVISSGPEEVTVPDLTGLTQANAAAAIAAARLAVGTFSTEPSDTVPAGRVIAQSPAAGTSAALDAMVDLTISSGPATILVPDVGGLTQAAATAAIVDAGLATGSIVTASSAAVPAGMVIDQVPGANAAVTPGTHVALTISSGPAAGLVPYVIGETQAAAAAAIVAARLTVGAITAAQSNSVGAGDVISSAPVAGTSVPIGAAVALVVSSGPAPVIVPDVVGQPESAAIAIVIDAGLGLASSVTVESATVPAGHVIGQSPGGGRGVTPGSLVTLTISSGPVDPSTVVVPDVVGQPQAAAAAAIANAGLVVGIIANAESATVPAGHVIGASPGAGNPVAPGTAIDLTISGGAPDPPTVLVPGVVGQTQAAALAAIADAGLTGGTLTTANSANVPAGTVISQQPQAGTSTSPGSAVALVVSLGPVTVPPVTWLTADIGAVGRTGSASYDGTTHSVTGAGADVWGSADALRFVYQSLAGDGQIVARVATVQNTNAWVKAGVMIRGGLSAGAAQGMMMVTPGKGNNFQRRPSSGGATVGTAGLSVTAPYWVKLTRTGNLVAAYQSIDGATWSLVGTEIIALPAEALVGLGVSSHSTTTLATATFDRVTVGPIPDTTAPSVTASPAGGTFASAQMVTLTASEPAAIYFTTDGSAPSGASTPYTAPVSISATTTLRYLAIDAAQNVSPIGTQQYTIGVADTVAPVVIATPPGGTYTGALSIALVPSEPSSIRYTLDGTLPTEASAPYTAAISLTTSATLRYLAVDAAGNQSSGSQSYTILPGNGLAAPWATADVGAVGRAGSGTFSPATSTYAVTGAGADIWDVADAFRYVYRPLSGDGQIIARVASVQNTNAWVKAGVMIRTDLTPGAAQAMMMVTPGKSNNFQRRTTAGGITTGTTGAAVTAPYWVKLTRTGNTIAAYQSVNGVTWSLVGTATFAMPADVMVGLAVSSHSTTVVATATFDQVTVVAGQD